MGEETRVVCTMDREVNFPEVFVERRALAPLDGRAARDAEWTPRYQPVALPCH